MILLANYIDTLCQQHENNSIQIYFFSFKTPTIICEFLVFSEVNSWIVTLWQLFLKIIIYGHHVTIALYVFLFFFFFSGCSSFKYNLLV